jgi:hypothetical protein
MKLIPLIKNIVLEKGFFPNLTSNIQGILTEGGRLCTADPLNKVACFKLSLMIFQM